MTLLTHFDSKNITSASLYSYTRFNPNHTGPRLSRVCFSQREIHYVAVNQGRWKLENWSQYKCPHGKRNPVYLHSLHTERTDEHINSKNWLNWLSRFLDVFSFDWFPPYRVLWSACYESWVILGPFYASFVLNGMAFTLQTLNVMWLTTIVRMVCDTIIAGKVFFTIPTILSRQGTKCYEYEVFG